MTLFKEDCLLTIRLSSIGVGFDNGLPHYRCFPGWLKGTWGYHGDDGKVYSCGSGAGYGQGYGEGDVIGCGIDKNGAIFYTQNGKHLGN